MARGDRLEWLSVGVKMMDASAGALRWAGAASMCGIRVLGSERVVRHASVMRHPTDVMLFFATSAWNSGRLLVTTGRLGAATRQNRGESDVVRSRA
jgi:hypothetical protein